MYLRGYRFQAVPRLDLTVAMGQPPSYLDSFIDTALAAEEGHPTASRDLAAPCSGYSRATRRSTECKHVEDSEVYGIDATRDFMINITVGTLKSWTKLRTKSIRSWCPTPSTITSYLRGRSIFRIGAQYQGRYHLFCLWKSTADGTSKSITRDYMVFMNLVQLLRHPAARPRVLLTSRSM